MKLQTTRNWSLGLLVALILVGVFWWWSASKKSDPNTVEELVSMGAGETKKEGVKLTMKMASSTVTDIEVGQIKVASQVIIQNPLPTKLSANRWDYTILINGRKVAAGSRIQPFELPARGSNTITLPMTIAVKDMDAVIDQMDAARKDMATYTFLNTIHTDVPVAGRRLINYNFKEELPIVRLPKLRVADIDISDFGFKNSGMEAIVEVTNRNPFPIRMEDGKYSMVIDGKTTLTGALQEVVNLPAKQTVPISMQMDMKTGQAMKMGWKMLFNSDNTRYTLTFDAKVRSESKLLKNSALHFAEEGKLADLKNELKKARE